jgi:hypothetical protein
MPPPSLRLLDATTNDTLGAVVLTLDNDALVLDAGEFRSQLKPLRGAADQLQTYLLVDPPIAGLEFTFTDDGGQATMTLAGFGLGPYTFSRIK